MPAKKRPKSVEISRLITWRRTISRDLVISLVLAVTIVFVLTISINYIMTSQKFERQNNRKALEYIEYLQTSCELPLWYFDKEGIDLISNSFIRDESVKTLIIVDSEGNTMFEKHGEDETDLLEVSGEVSHGGQVVGHIEIGLSRQFSREKNLQLLKSSVIILLLIVTVLIAVTSLLLKIFLQNPLNYLVDRIDRLAKSDYAYKSRKYKQREIETIISKFNDMADRVRNREESLGAINIRLEKEIEARGKKEAALRESEEKFRALVESSSDWIWEMDVKGVYMYVSPRVEAIVGYRPDEMVGKTPFDLIPPRDAGRLREMFKKFVKTGAPIVGLVNVFPHKDGRPVVLETSGVPFFDGDGRVAGYRGVDRDITKRKRAEEEVKKHRDHLEELVEKRARALKESEERFRALTEKGSDIIVIVGEEGTFTYASPSVQKYGYTQEEVVGRPMEFFIHPEDLPLIEERLNYILGHIDETVGIEALRIRDKKGSWVILEGTGANMITQPGVHGIVFNGHEITHLKQAEKELKKARDEAESANRAKSEFLANMSHEIRTPLNGIIGMTGLLMDTGLTGEQRQFAGILRDSGEALLGLINDILDFSKIEAGKLEMEVIDFDLHALLDDFAEMMAFKAHEKKLELTCAASPGTPAFLRGDPGRLRQVLINLVGNAVKFTREGDIAIRASLLLETEGDAVVRFSVKDSGVGVPREKQADLFSRFTQVDASTTRKYGGAGLGLAISRQLSEAMGGEIGVISEEGEGAEFWFTARFLKQPARDREALPAIDLGSASVFIVDGAAANREILRDCMERHGARVDEAAEGEKALSRMRDAAAAGAPHQAAIISKWLPDMDGEALGRAIKADPAISDARLVMMTSLGERGDARRLTEIGFAAYLPKPVRQSDMLDTLMAILSGTQVRLPIITRHSIREMRRRAARILLVEDNITNQRVTLGILKKLGLTADVAANGAEAVKFLEDAPRDLVLMDCQMPVMDGFEAASRIRDPRSRVLDPDIPIIALTAKVIAGDREKCLSAGMNDYLSKPVEPRTLADMLEKWLPGEGGGMKEEEPAQPDARGPDAGSDSDATRVFNKAVMMELLMDDEELARTVIDGFLEDLPKQIALLKGRLEDGDASGAGRQAHTIKGAAANLGGEILRETALEMEKAGTAGDLDAITRRLPRLEEEFERMKEAIEREFGGKESDLK
ncbi:MAG: PAS domain S-box protein [Desulfobacterales bacterium]|nr:PAS domain S-box protein [Desulfobacterales bacterium]